VLRRFLTVLPVMTFVLTLLLAAAAFAQQIGGDQGPVGGEDAVQAGDNVQYAAVCQNIIGAFEASAGQGATAGAFAAGEENAAAVAEIAQNQNVSVSQVNECLNDAGAGERPGVNAAKDQYAKANVIATTIPKKPLPNTGGIPLHGLFAVLGLASVATGASVLRAATQRRR
jgi:hypothetical protein